MNYKEMKNLALERMEDIATKAETEDRELTEDEDTEMRALEKRVALYDGIADDADTLREYQEAKEEESEERRLTTEELETRELDQVGRYIGKQLTEEERGELNVTTDGVAMIPSNVEGLIVRMLDETAPIFAQARKFPSVKGSLRIGKENDLSVAGFVGEGENLDFQKIDIGEIKLEQKRVGSYMTISQQLINDVAFDVGAYAIERLSKSIAKAIEISMLTGTRDDEFRGMVHNDEVAKVTTDVISTDTLMDLFNSINPSYIADSAFYMSRALWNEVSKLKDGEGHYFIQNGVVNGKPTTTIFNLPVYVTSALDEEFNKETDTNAVFGSIKDAYAIMIKKGFNIKQISNDTTQALRASTLILMDGFMDGELYNTQAIALLDIDLKKE